MIPKIIKNESLWWKYYQLKICCCHLQYCVSKKSEYFVRFAASLHFILGDLKLFIIYGCLLFLMSLLSIFRKWLCAAPRLAALMLNRVPIDDRWTLCHFLTQCLFPISKTNSETKNYDFFQESIMGCWYSVFPPLIQYHVHHVRQFCSYCLSISGVGFPWCTAVGLKTERLPLAPSGIYAGSVRHTAVPKVCPPHTISM